MLSFMLFVLVSIWLYRNYQYRKLNRRDFTHSSYYEAAYGGDRKCTAIALQALQDIGGAKRILQNYRLTEGRGNEAEINENLDTAELILIHETGIYLVETRDYEGRIEGSLQDQYWMQTITGGREYTGYRNFFYNPLLKNEENIEKLKKKLSDMPWIVYSSIVVFSAGCSLDIGIAEKDSNVGIVKCGRLSLLMYDMIRNARIFLGPQVIGQIYERLVDAGDLLEEGKGADSLDK